MKIKGNGGVLWLEMGWSQLGMITRAAPDGCFQKTAMGFNNTAKFDGGINFSSRASMD
jgi:hypothetical protein